MIFIEIKKWGDFDMSYTDSVWYSMDAVLNPQIRIQHLINDCGEKIPERFSISTNNHSPVISIYCGRKQESILEGFKDLLQKRGYQLATTTQIQFSDESLEYGEEYKKEE